VDKLLTHRLDQLTAKLSEVFLAKGRGEAINVPRRRSSVGHGLRYQEMAAGSVSLGFFGSKMYLGGTDGGAHGLIVLFETATGRVRVVVDATSLNGWRTGAATALATDYLAPRESRRVALIGTGDLAPGQLRAVCSVRGIEEAMLYSRNPERARLFRESQQDNYDVKMTVVTTLREAVEDADVVVTGTTATAPIEIHDFLKSEVHINAVGANSQSKREIESKVVKACRLIVVDDLHQAKQEAADLIEPVTEELITWDDVVELGDLINRDGGVDRSGWTLFESQGVALEDVATAQLLYELATEEGVGVKVSE